jgi:hypothetical protein
VLPASVRLLTAPVTFTNNWINFLFFHFKN